MADVKKPRGNDFLTVSDLLSEWKPAPPRVEPMVDAQARKPNVKLPKINKKR